MATVQAGAYLEGYDMAIADVLKVLDREISTRLMQAEQTSRHNTDRTMQRVFAEIIQDIRDKVAELGCE